MARVKARTRTGKRRTTTRHARRGSGSVSKSKKPKVMVEFAGYHTCPACQKQQQYLRQNHIKYKFYPVDSKKGAELAGNAQSVPYTKVCNVSHGKSSNCKTAEGFDPNWFKRVLNL